LPLLGIARLKSCSSFPSHEFANEHLQEAGGKLLAKDPNDSTI
jgi:hypothetical protein